MINVRLFGGLKQHTGGAKRIELAFEDVKSVEDILHTMRIPKGEVGQVLINGTPMESSRTFNDTVSDGDEVDFYPISAGG
ncbi:MAG: MoaD/ThiS family protein [Deltaproteobacteria bacterium]|uniref:MoaD/ThiS family protein n=1 Tax=Candidatus Zymogenus saltonus TaxID=2844893 RepID=A0A9D8PPF7_9DELT|nr:MoaD/ThiS family protein [Candidatus Zymogenus saltonus]